MYLDCLETGHRFLDSQLLRLMTHLAPRVPLDIVKVLMYRADYFGVPLCRLGQVLLRGPVSLVGWTVGERELIAAFTSTLNHCVF
jgi:hypothetical protein